MAGKARQCSGFGGFLLVWPISHQGLRDTDCRIGRIREVVAGRSPHRNLYALRIGGMFLVVLKREMLANESTWSESAYGNLLTVFKKVRVVPLKKLRCRKKFVRQSNFDSVQS